MLIFERWGRWGGTYELRGESNLRSRIPWLEPPRPANEVLPRLPLCLRWDWTLVPLAHETLATRYYRLGFLFNVQMFNSNSTVCLAKACTLMADYYWELSPFWGIQSTTLIHSSSVRHSYNFGTSQTLLNSLSLTCPQRVFAFSKDDAARELWPKGFEANCSDSDWELANEVDIALLSITTPSFVLR